MYLKSQLSSIRNRFGYPFHQWTTHEFDEQGWNLIQKSLAQKRSHDVTMLIEGPDGRFALMSKHNYPPGVYRSPSGGVKLGEDLVTGALREALEETGLSIELKRFLLHFTLDASFNGKVATWDSYVFHAVTKNDRLAPIDLKEVKDTRWVGRAEMGAIIDKLHETGNGGLVYRGELTQSSLWALDHSFSIREAGSRDLPAIAKALISNKQTGINIEDTLWWIAELDGLFTGTIGLTPHEDCMELTGLTVDPLYRDKGIGHALVEYACDQWKDPEKKKKHTQMKQSILNDKLWLLTENPAYFLPVNFTMTDTQLLPASLKKNLVGMKSRWSGMRYQLYKL